MSDAMDSVWSTGEDGSVTVTLKVKGGHEIPWIVLRFKNVSEAVAAFEREDGAEMMKLFRLVSGAQKAFDLVYNNREAPPSGTQGKPEGADRPSPQVTTNADPFETGDDAPPFGAPEEPSCKHGVMKKVTHGGKTGFICHTKPKDDPERCATVFV